METNPNPDTTVVPSPEETHHKKASTAMVLSIIGLALFILPGFNLAGLVLSIIGLVQSAKNRKLAAEYTIKEDSMNTAGYVCGLIGVIAGGLSVLAFFAILALTIGVGVAALTAGAPYVSEIITDSMPLVEDALESALPGALSILTPFLSVL